jgi:Fanconi anemia group M protein|tara:strand:+ start:1067 stop:2617 length:1551 start_codon:yes stop_codon:yes gene_type:complete
LDFLEGIAPRDYQKKIFETCLNKNCLVVLPTGLGKTLIALMLTIERMKKFPGEKVLFLAPTKPLAEQHLNYFKKHLPELFAEMQLFTGAINAEKRKKIWKTADIIFSTPQCIANDLKNNLYDLSEICLLIEDEAHKCLKNYDYNYVAQQYKKQAEHQRIIGLTASPGSEKSKIKEICKNLSIEEVGLRTRDSDDVKKYLQELEFEKIDLDFPLEFEKIREPLKKLFNDYVTELRTRKLLFSFASKTELINLQKKIAFAISRGKKNFNYLLGMSACAQAIKIQHALELLETQTLKGFNEYLKNLIEQAKKNQSRGVVKLVSKPEFNFVFKKTNELLEKSIEHPKIEKIIEIIKKEKSKDIKSKVIIFTQFRDTASLISEKINRIGKIKSEIFVGQTLKKGIGLKQKDQKKIINEFSIGEIDILCATCIGEEGLDIPEVNTVIFYEPVASAIRTIQRGGRTARLMQGKIIILITKKTRDETYFYVSKTKEKKMYAAIDSIKKDLNNNILLKDERQKKL